MGERGHLLKLFGSPPPHPTSQWLSPRETGAVLVFMNREGSSLAVFNNPLHERALLPAQLDPSCCSQRSRAPTVYSVISGCPVVSSLARTLTVGKKSCRPWHPQGQAFLVSSFITGSVIWPAGSSTLLSLLSLPKERWDPGPAKPLIDLFPAPSLTQPPPTICHLPWMPLIWLEGKGIGFIKNCWHLKLASTALGCQLNRGRKNSLGLIPGPNKASHGL